MAKSKAGGGIRSNKNVSPSVRYGDRARAISPKGIAQIGTQRGDHATAKARLLKGDVEAVRGPLKPAGGPGGIGLGNAMAKPCGPKGEGRTLYGQSGTQQTYGGAPEGKPAPRGGRDTLGGE